MRKLPPSSAATLPSAFLSFLVHAGVVVAGLMVMPLEQPKASVAQMIVVPIELVTVAEMTNLTAVSAMAEDKPLEEEVKAEESNPAAGAPPPDEDSVSFEPPPKEPPKEESGGLFKNKLGYESSKQSKDSTTLGFNGIDPSGKIDKTMMAK